MEEAFALVSQAESAAKEERHGEASQLFVAAVNAFQDILSAIKDERSRTLIHDQCNDFRRRAVAEQDLADARRVDKEAEIQARLDALKGGGGAGAEAALRESRKGNGTSTVADLEARFDSLRGPQKRAPMAEEIQARLKALGGTTEFPDYIKEKRAEEARLNALVSQIADVDGGNNNNGDDDGIDDEKLKGLVASALGQTGDVGGGAMGTDLDMSNTLVAAGTDFLDGDDADLVEQIVRQAKDELRYGNVSGDGDVSQTDGEDSAEKVKETSGSKRGDKKGRSRTRKGGRRRQHDSESDLDSDEEDERSESDSDEESDRERRSKPKSRTWFGFRR